jgi:phenylalanyl-tRNA synthetase beta chain
VPQSTLVRPRVLSMLPCALPEAELTEILFGSKAELARATAEELQIEVTPDRLDLLSEGGLGLLLQGATGSAKGLPKLLTRAPEPTWTVRVDPSVAPLRPEIAAVVVVAPPGASLDAGLLAEAVRFQEILHATVGLDRRLASLGIYPMERLTPPFRYALEPIDGVRLVPLDGVDWVAAREFLSSHPLTRRYGAYGTSGDRMLTLRDKEGTLLSIPPILNTRDGGEARVGDRILLIESTGSRASRVAEGVGLLELVFRARGWSASPVRIEFPDRSDDGRRLVESRSLDLPAATLSAVSGRAHSAAEVEHLLARARLGSHPHPHGWTVEIPPWRPDLLTHVDLVEDVVLARGVRAEDGELPPSRTIGRRRPETRFRRSVAATLLGLGYVPLYTPVLVSEEAVQLLGRTDSVALTNPVSDQFARMRDRLQIALVQVLGRNVRRPYPQRFSEVGPVVVPDGRSESGARTSYHAGVFEASESAGFADAAALADYLLAGFDARGVREPVELPGTIPGRAARLRVAGETVAEIGEIHPSVLASLGVPVPVAWMEVDLTALWPLVRRTAD